ncbi:MAG: substrate-binding domain-containing protein [Planctomycetota bacterium]|jgi:phosphonate transport system substrate-binding protein
MGRSLLRILALTIGVAAVVWVVIELFAPGDVDSRFEPHAWVNLDEPGPSGNGRSEPADAGRLLRVAVAPVISPERSLELYRDFVGYLGAQLDRRPVPLTKETYAQVNDLVRYGRCDAALVCTYAFVRGEREFGMKLLVIPEIDGAITYHSYIIVRINNPANTLLDLRGKRFASADIMSNTGWLYPWTWLKERGRDPDTFFSRQEITGSHDRSIDAVMNGDVDGAAVDSLVYEDMATEGSDVRTKTRVILKSPPFGMPPLVVPADLDPVLENRLRDVLLTMHESEAGKEALDKLGVTRFRIPPEGLYQSVREAAAAMEHR